MRDTENEPRADRREAGRHAEENELQTDGEDKKGKLTNLADDTCLVSSRGLNAKRSSGNMTDWIRNITTIVATVGLSLCMRRKYM